MVISRRTFTLGAVGILSALLVYVFMTSSSFTAETRIAISDFGETFIVAFAAGFILWAALKIPAGSGARRD